LRSIIYESPEPGELDAEMAWVFTKKKSAALLEGQMRNPGIVYMGAMSTAEESVKALCFGMYSTLGELEDFDIRAFYEEYAYNYDIVQATSGRLVVARVVRGVETQRTTIVAEHDSDNLAKFMGENIGAVSLASGAIIKDLSTLWEGTDFAVTSEPNSLAVSFRVDDTVVNFAAA
jgi:hypothetical protein